MYYTGIDPRTMKPVYVPTNPHEKAMQRALIQYRNPKNYELVCEALKIAGREDLIGFDKKCLVRPRHQNQYQRQNQLQKGQTAGKGYPVKNNNTTEGKNQKKKTIRNVHKKKTK